jgi:hypothetical protein
MNRMLNSGEHINVLKEYFLPAIHHCILKGKTKRYQLSVPINGTEVVVKRSIKPIKHASLANVIAGAIIRLERLFHPDKLHIKVFIYTRPEPSNLSIKFELINLNSITINGEQYFLTVVAEYSYSKMEQVTYIPVLYRQVCSNGMATMLGERFKETVAADKIFDISCEWTKCSFEQYQRQYSNYINFLKQTNLSPQQTKTLVSQMVKKMVKTSRVKPNRLTVERNANNLEGDFPERNINTFLSMYIEEFGRNGLAVLNAVTDFASRETDSQIRLNSFLNIGRYLQKEIKKITKMDFKYWSESLTWEELTKSSK